MTYQRKLQAALLASVFLAPKAFASQLPLSAFQSYSAANAAGITAGPLALYAVPVFSIAPTQLNEGFAEIGKKTAGFDLLTPAQLPGNLLTDIEPVVIGPGGQLYLTDGHHTFTALENSIYGASNPTVYVDVIANYSNLTPLQFWTQMQANNFLFAVDNGIAQTVNLNNGAPIPATLQGLTSDPYRGLEYFILKNKSSKLFTNSTNITGAAGASTPGLDKMTGFYADFISAAGYRGANNGLGLPYLSPGDVALATQWNLNGASATTMPGVGAVTEAQLPGYILPAAGLTVSSVISDSSLSTGTLDGNGGFTGITSFKFGNITVGTPQVGFVLQMGSDKGGAVTLSGTNTYNGGTSILAGTLNVSSDANLGAVSAGYTYNAASIAAGIHAANGIIFNSLAEGMGTLNATTSFSITRPIAIGGEVANIGAAAGQTLTLAGQIVSLGVGGGGGVGNATGESDLQINGAYVTAAPTGTVVLAAGANNPNFYGNIIISAGTLDVSSDGAMGNTIGNPLLIGQIDLDGGTLQTEASFNSVRSIFLTGSSQFDTAGFTTSFAGTLTDTQRTFEVMNTSTTSAGAVTFGSALIGGGTATLQLAGGTQGETVTFTNGISRQNNATLVLQPASTTSLGGIEKILSPTQTLTNGIVSPWIMDNNAASNGVGPYDFVTYGANGYVKATYGATDINSSNNSTVVDQTGNATLAGNAAAYALKVESGKTITLGSNTLTIGDGTNPAGLILAAATPISGGTLAFGGSEAVVWTNTTSTINSLLTGTGGLTVAGSGTLALTSATPSTLTGGVVIDSGTLALSANAFATDQTLTLADTKSHPAKATLTSSGNNTFAALNSVGTNSVVTFTGGVLTIGDSSNLNSVLSSTVTIANVANGLTKAGTGLLDLSGMSSGGLKVAGSTSSVLVAAGQLRIAGNDFNSGTMAVSVSSGAELQIAASGGQVFANPISGAGDVRLIGGTLKVTGAWTQTGGTFVEVGSTLDITTSTLATSTNSNITDAGGLVLFDQATAGTYAGVISDGLQMGVGAKLSGSFDEDDSTGGNVSGVTLSAAQTYSGATHVEAGTLTLGIADAIASSSGIDLGRVGGAVDAQTANLVFTASQSIASLSSEQNNTATVQMGASNLTLTGGSGTFYGVISGSGSVSKTGSGTEILDGVNTYGGGTTLSGGVLEVGDATHTTASITGPVTINAGGTLAGHGTVNGTITVNAGATLKPGGSVGTLNTGSVAFVTGSSFTDEVSPAATSVLASTGTVTLASGVHFLVTPDAGTYARITNYANVITATGGVSGTFADASATGGFTPFLSYGANSVSLELVKNDVTPLASTPNQLAAATGLSSIGGSPLFDALVPQSDATVTAALNSISGEVHGAVASALVYDSRFLTDAIQARPKSDGEISGWVDGNGRSTNFHSDGNAGNANGTLGGFSAGADMAVLDDLRLGAAAGYSHDSLGVAARASKADVNSAYAGAYADYRTGPLQASLMVSYSWDSISTARAVGFTGFSQTETASYDGNTLALVGEVRSRVDLPDPVVVSYIEPFLDLSYANLHTDAFKESASIAALNGLASTRQADYFDLGARFGNSYQLSDSFGIDAMASMALEHSMSGNQYGANLAFAAGGSSFSVLGPVLARDALAVQLGAQTHLTDSLGLNLMYQGRIAGQTTEHGVTANLRMDF